MPKKARVRCPVCGRVVAVKNGPRLHCEFIRKHRDKDPGLIIRGKDCTGGGLEVYAEDYVNE